MAQYSDKNRSALCRLITDFHSVSQQKIARYDFLGMTLSSLMLMVLAGFARLLISH